MSNPLANSPADIMRYALIGLGLGVLPSNPPGLWPIYESNEPALPDNCITVYDTQGTDDGRSMIDGKLFYHFGFQVRVRANDQPTGWQKIDSIRDTLARGIYALGVVIGANSYVIHCASHIGQILVLGKETPTSKRSLFTLNATMALDTPIQDD